MSSAYVPAELVVPLSAPLAVRGVRIASRFDEVTVSVGASRGPGLRWLALADSEAAAVALLDEGADDVVLPGCGIPLLAARIARLARPSLLAVGTLVIDPVARRAWRGDRELDLLPREYALLLHLARHADRVVTRQQLRSAVLGRDFDPGTNVVEVHVSRLRAQLDRGSTPMLLTERGRGYRLVSEPDIAERRRAS